MSSDQFVETRFIPLPQGGDLEVQMSQQFIDRVKQHYGLKADQTLDDDHVRMYVWGAATNAVDKAERNAGEQRNVVAGEGTDAAPGERGTQRSKKGS
jgi:hypothetical protein